MSDCVLWASADCFNDLGVGAGHYWLWDRGLLIKTAVSLVLVVWSWCLIILVLLLTLSARCSAETCIPIPFSFPLPFPPVWCSAECRKRRLNHGSFVSAVFLVARFLWFVLCLYVHFCDLYWVFPYCLFVSNSPVIGCEDRLRND